MDRMKIENVAIRYMILENKKFDTIHGKIPEDLYNRLVNRKMRAQDDNKKMRENVIRQFCDIRDNDHLK